MKIKAVKLCAGNAYSIIPQEKCRLDLGKVAHILEEHGIETENQGVMLIAHVLKTEVTIYTNGRLLVHPSFDKHMAESIANIVFSLIDGKN